MKIQDFKTHFWDMKNSGIWKIQKPVIITRSAIQSFMHCSPGLSKQRPSKVQSQILFENNQSLKCWHTPIIQLNPPSFSEVTIIELRSPLKSQGPLTEMANKLRLSQRGFLIEFVGLA